jgi:hypothetical protein
LSSIFTSNVVYEGCNFAGRSFEASDLTAAIFSNCDLRGTILTRTTHSHTEFINCDLTGTNFYFAELHSTTFVNSPLDDSLLLHALVPRTFELPAHYAINSEANTAADSPLALVVYDPTWLSDVARLTKTNPAALDTLLSEHPSITPRKLFALLSALSEASTS